MEYQHPMKQAAAFACPVSEQVSYRKEIARDWGTYVVE
jgi:hypothetical protein